ncbi:dihydrofolate reductase family protein [Macellibacteroides fermentans]|nr:hypothetical protein [Macellibacteroides fermentans]
MKRIILYIAASLDQRIAEPDGGLEWLIGLPNPKKEDYGYKEVLASVDTVIMGGRTYREFLNMDIIWPYSEQMAYVVSHHNGAKKKIYASLQRMLLKRFPNFAIKREKIFYLSVAVN